MAVTWQGDLGFGQVPIESTQEWLAQYSKYVNHYRYYSGLIFNERVDMPGEEDPPLLYPVKINLVKLMAHTQADSLWGEWEDRVFHLNAYPKEGEVAPEKIQALIRYLYALLDDNGIEAKMWECGLDQMRFGGTAVKVSRDPKKEYGVRIERVPVAAFYPIWSPDSFDDLIEVWVITQIDAKSAKAFFQVEPQNDFVIRAEHWVGDRYENYIDGKKLDRFSGVHRLKRLPFEYVPRLRSDGFYGEALTDDITGVQDELNMRVGDVGEAITYNAHPIKWGYNLPSDINDANKYPYAPDRLWDLGNHMPGSDPPSLNVLESRNPVPEATFRHIRFILDWTRTASYSPPIAFGEDEGSQRSGATLQLRMWPLTRAIRRTRSYWKMSLLRIIRLAVDINRTNGSKTIPADILDTYDKVILDVDLAPILPRERAELVNEVVMRAQTEPASISQEGTLETLGVRDPQLEMERIKRQEEEKQERAQELMKQQALSESSEDKKPDEKKKDKDEDRVAD